MNLLSEFRKLILPLVRRFYWVVLGLSIAVGFASHYVKYTTPMYESVARIKLDDKKVGISNNNLYYDFDVFSSINKVETEVEVLKSRLLWERVLRKLGFHVLIYRVGKLKKTQLYDDSPLVVDYEFLNHDAFDKNFTIQVVDTSSFIFTNVALGFQGDRFSFGDTIRYKYSWLCITKNDALIELNDLQLVDLYELNIMSEERLVMSFNEKNIDIVAMDKEVAVLRIAFKNDHPRKAADFANALAEAYIDDYISSKSFAATKTLQFIDERLAAVRKDLIHSEILFENFKRRNGVINTVQETDAGIKKMVDVQLQLNNLKMNEEAVAALEEHIKSDEYFDATATQFGFGDLTFTELVKKLTLYNEERRKLLKIYTEDHIDVKNLDENIAMVKRYILSAIEQARRDLALKREKIAAVYEQAIHQFDGLPQRERNYVTLEREFRLNERMYNFLSEKRMEASIASAALISFHRIIQEATPADKPVSPNKTLIMFVSGLFGLIVGIAVAFIHDAVTAKIGGRGDIDKACSVPILGVVRHLGQEPEKSRFWLLALTKQLELRLPKENALLAVASGVRLEGKTMLSQGIAQAFSQMRKQVAWVDMDTTSSRTEDHPGLTQVLAGEHTLEEIRQKQTPTLDYYPIGRYTHGDDALYTEGSITGILQTLRERYGRVVIDAPSMLMSVNGYFILRQTDRIVYLFRSRHTKLEFVSFADQVKQACDPVPMNILLNDVKGSVDFTGQYQGGTFTRLPVWRRVLNWIEIPRWLKSFSMAGVIKRIRRK